MTKKADQIEVHATKEGKLYIKPSDLFNQTSVQKLIQKVVKSEALKQVHKVG